MPQITPFARAALIEFLVLSLFTGQMSKLPPYGTSPAGPSRAPGGQRVPARPGCCRAALPDRAGRGAVTCPGRPPGTGPAQPPPRPGAGTRPDGGGKGNLGAGTRSGMVPAPSPGSLPRSATLPGVLRRPARPSPPPGYPAPRNFGRLRAAELRATCEREHGP